MNPSSRPLGVSGRQQAIGWAVGGRGCSREREAEGAALADCALCPNPSAVRLHDTLGDEQSEAQPATVILRDLPEPLEDALQLVARDSRASIGDEEANIGVRRFDSDR